MKSSLLEKISSILKKWQYLKKSILFVSALIMLMSTTQAIAGVPNTYQSQFSVLSGRIKSLLVAENYPMRDEVNHTSIQYVLGEAYQGISITVYGITDKSIIKKIIALCILEHSKNPELRYHLYMIKETSEESHKTLINSETPILRLTLNKEK
jgi:hypothetical protein